MSKFTGFDNSKDLLFWNKRLLSIGGMWPLQSSYFRFHLCMFYCASHLCLMFVDLYQVRGDLSTIIANLSTTALALMIISKMLVVRYSSTLRKLMRQIAANENDIDYKNKEEREIYMSYTQSGIHAFKILLGITVTATSFYYFKKLNLNYKPKPFEETPDFPLPYRICIFFNISIVRNYYLIYAYQSPMVYVYSCQSIVALFVFSLILDTCAQLSVLAFRIKNTKPTNSELDKRLESELREIVLKHNKILRNSKIIDGAFNIALLIEIVSCTGIMALCMYNIIVNSEFSEATEFVSFCLYIFTMVGSMYGYCFAGDLLARESLNLRDSYYECDWYDMPPRCKRIIIMCMIRSRAPLQLTGGGFYIYSVESFTGVCKTAMGFGSMLRQSV